MMMRSLGKKKGTFNIYSLNQNVPFHPPFIPPQIARNAPEKDEYLNLYTLSQIFKCFSVPPFEIMPPEESGFVVVGSCTNGDQIVLNTSDDYGAVYYLNHESIYSEAYKLAKVALTLDEFMALANECENPIDYYEALDLDVR